MIVMELQYSVWEINLGVDYFVYTYTWYVLKWNYEPMHVYMFELKHKSAG